MTDTDKDIDARIAEATKEFTAQGRLIEAGFIGLVIRAYPKAEAWQINEMRTVFFAGAQHLFSSIMGMLDAGEEPTDDDLERMSKIAQELDLFIVEFQRKHGLSG